MAESNLTSRVQLLDMIIRDATCVFYRFNRHPDFAHCIVQLAQRLGMDIVNKPKQRGSTRKLQYLNGGVLLPDPWSSSPLYQAVFST